jgi:transcriptional regulator with XRE-family HTH domain
MMTLGEKMKYIRKKRGLTQQDLAGTLMTRNMISQIERGAATPSLQALEHFAKVLDVDPSVFFDCGLSIEQFENKRQISEIKSYYADKKYAMCIRLSLDLSENSDDDYRLMMYDCYYHEGISRFENSDLSGALEYFRKAESYAEGAPFPPFYSGRILFMRELIEGYLNGSHIVSVNLFSTLSQDPDNFFEYALYTILMTLIDNNQIERATAIYDTIRLRNEGYRLHINAKLAAARFNLDRAKALLLSVVEREDEFSAPFLFDVYEDLERYCKSLEDYETAYRCAIVKEKYRYVSK